MPAGDALKRRCTAVFAAICREKTIIVMHVA